MQFIKKSNRQQPKISLILLDWSVRESYHLLHYLGKQNVDRNLFEVIVVEYYSRVSDAIRPFEDQVDSWLLLEMSEDCYYHKHLMYNAGIVAARGDICVICDSDAMVKEGFIRAIITEFESNSGIVLHIDQFRNARKDLYPFRYPDFVEVTGKGCINNVDGKTRGVVDDMDSIHNRNYGACMCARRADLIAIGGADEHIDFLGHICGPYEMTFRLVNNGLREVWHEKAFSYHTWHPGQAGVDNYSGPHDGRQVSTTALDALRCGRKMPLVENEAIKLLRTGESMSLNQVLVELLSEEKAVNWKGKPQSLWGLPQKFTEGGSRYKGFECSWNGHHYAARPVFQAEVNPPVIIMAATIKELKQKINALPYTLPQIWMVFTRVYSLLCQLWVYRSRLAINPSSAGQSDRKNKVLFSMPDIFIKLIRFERESRFVGSLLGELVAVLWLLGKMYNRDAPNHRITVLIDQVACGNYLYWLQKLRVLPMHTVRIIEDEDGLDGIGCDGDCVNEIIVVYSRTFFCFYQKILIKKLIHQIIVT